MNITVGDIRKAAAERVVVVGDDARELIAEQFAAGTEVNLWRYPPVNRAIKRVVAGFALGQPVSVQKRRDQSA